MLDENNKVTDSKVITNLRDPMNFRVSLYSENLL